MAIQLLRDAETYVNGYDLTGDMNVVALAPKADLLDITTFASNGSRERRGGLRSIALQLEGFANLGTGLQDEVSFGLLGAVDPVFTLAPLTGAEGEVAYSFLGAAASYHWGGAVGEMLRYSLAGEGDGDLVRGTLLHHATRTTTGTGTIIQLGAVGATQKLYAALHVFAVAGTTPTLIVKVQSAALVGFGSPVDRITFASQNAVIGVWAPPVLGPITDQFWRVTWTIGGGTPSFTFALNCGIQ